MLLWTLGCIGSFELAVQVFYSFWKLELFDFSLWIYGNLVNIVRVLCQVYTQISSPRPSAALKPLSVQAFLLLTLMIMLNSNFPGLRSKEATGTQGRSHIRRYPMGRHTFCEALLKPHTLYFFLKIFYWIYWEWHWLIKLSIYRFWVCNSIIFICISCTELQVFFHLLIFLYVLGCLVLMCGRACITLHLVACHPLHWLWTPGGQECLSVYLEQPAQGQAMFYLVIAQKICTKQIDEWDDFK